MTSRQWRRSQDTLTMIGALRGLATKRKAQLYLCGGCRAIWDLLYDARSRAAVEVAERFADGHATLDELGYANYKAECPTFGYDFLPGVWREWHPDGSIPPEVATLVEMGVMTPEQLAEEEPEVDAAVRGRLLAAASLAEAAAGRSLFDHDWWQRHIRTVPWPGAWLLHCIFGDPFAPFVFFSPAWRSPAAVDLARSMYEGRAFDRMPELGEALEAAGCRNWDMIEHCRNPHPHARGCWVVDLVLGKS